MLRNFVLAFIAFQLATAIAVSQQLEKTDDCFNATILRIPFQADNPTVQNRAVDEKELKKNIVHYLDEDGFTFWYKIYVEEDCSFRFNVSATNATDEYDFMIYKFNKDQFCNYVFNKKTKALSANKYLLSKAENDGAEKIDGRHVAYQNTILAKSGDRFYISVLSLTDKDCGHKLTLHANEVAITVNALHRPCFDFELPSFDQPKAMPLTADRKEEQMSGMSHLPAQKLEQEEPEKEPEALEFIDRKTGKKRDDDFLEPGDYLLLNNIYFHPNTYALKETSDDQLNDLLQFLQVNKGVEVEIQGHTAANTPIQYANPAHKGKGPEWNYVGNAKKLSKLRADAVKEKLVALGVEKNRLSTKGFGGDRRHIKFPKNKEEYRKNMRVEIMITAVK